MNKTETTASAGYILGVPLGMGFGLLLLLLFLGAALVHAERLPLTVVPVWTIAAVVCSSFLEALIAACRASRTKFLWGMIAATISLVCLIVCSLIWVGLPIDFKRVLSIVGGSFVAALIGSFIGASRLKRKRKK